MMLQKSISISHYQDVISGPEVEGTPKKNKGINKKMQILGEESSLFLLLSKSE